jgi:hypothetical protein
MRLSLTGFKTRLRETADRAARGTDVPAGIERGDDATAPPNSRERGRMRRRLRELRRLREAQLLELGALVLEAHRHERDDSPVIKRKAAEAAALDDEARALAAALETDGGLDTVVSAGVAGACPTCATLTSTTARFCSTCGTALDGRPGAAPRAGAELASAAPRASATADAEPAPAPAPEDAPTTELSAPNGDGTTHREAEVAAETGGET